MKRLAYLDGLRAVAVLSVLTFHAAVHDRSWDGTAGVGGLLLRQGAHGVDLFFVLSGFCLAYPFLLRAGQGSRPVFDTAVFAARRLIRIVPPYYAAIAVLLAAQMFTHDRADFGNVLRQALFLDGGTRLLNPSFWTLAIEFRWYFAFPLLLWLWCRSPKAFLTLGAALLLAALSTRASSVDVAVLPTFMLGIVAAHVAIRGWRYERFAPVAAVLLFAAACAGSRNGGWSYYWNPLWGPAMFFLVVSAGRSAWMRAALGRRPAVYVGTLSYGVYLLHEPLLSFMRSYLPLSGVALFAVSAAGALAGALLFAHAADRPFNESRLRDRLTRPVQSFCASALSFAGVPARIRLSADAEEPQRERASAAHAERAPALR